MATVRGHVPDESCHCHRITEWRRHAAHCLSHSATLKASHQRCQRLQSVPRVRVETTCTGIFNNWNRARRSDSLSLMPSSRRRALKARCIVSGHRGQAGPGQPVELTRFSRAMSPTVPTVAVPSMTSGILGAAI